MCVQLSLVFFLFASPCSIPCEKKTLLADVAAPWGSFDCASTNVCFLCFFFGFETSEKELCEKNGECPFRSFSFQNLDLNWLWRHSVTGLFRAETYSCFVYDLDQDFEHVSESPFKVTQKHCHVAERVQIVCWRVFFAPCLERS